ncbi:MAG: prepilin-type N-terminal cleavage/methylation domain-containing protein [Phycisphaera sp.]|nr:prepilin-type N-terminal cleavage/methylation domain-containing protein [Phycisphaera sp.]
MRKVKGFTIVELLVVMSILVLLMAILLPAMSTARHRAIRVGCQAQQHGLTGALLMYASDHFGALPDTRSRDVQWRTASEQELISSRYLGGEDTLWDCPSYWYKIYNDDGTRVTSGSGANKKYHQSYQYLGGKMDYTGFWIGLGKKWFSPMRLGTAKGSWEMLACRNERPQNGYPVKVVHGKDETLVLLPPGTQMTEGEVEGGNVAHLDGSTEWRNISEMSAHVNTSNVEWWW